MLNIQNINIVDLLKYKTVITSEVAVKKLEEIYKK
jgi:ribosomal protein L4